MVDAAIPLRFFAAFGAPAPVAAADAMAHRPGCRSRSRSGAQHQCGGGPSGLQGRFAASYPAFDLLPHERLARLALTVAYGEDAGA